MVVVEIELINGPELYRGEINRPGDRLKLYFVGGRVVKNDSLRLNLSGLWHAQLLEASTIHMNKNQ